MKKLFMFLAVAGLATFGASCSSDDSKNDDPKQKDLVLSGKTDVKEGDAVTFTVKVGDKAEAGTDLYVAGEKVSNPYTFTKKGEFKVQAKKNGFNDSNVLTVKVSEKDVVGPEPDPKTLVLSVVGGNEVTVGQDVVFLVKDNEGATVTGATIKKANATVANPWTATEAGTFKFVASKDGYENSNEISVVVNEVVVPEGQFLKVGDDNVSLVDAKFIYFLDGDYVYSEELEDGSVAVPFRMDMEGANAQTDVARFVIYVVQTPGQTQVKWPWQAAAQDILIASYTGKIGDVAWESDAETGFSNFTINDIINAPERVGAMTLNVEGNAKTSGKELLSKYDGSIKGLYTIDLGGDAAGIKKSSMTKMNKVNTNVSNLRRK